MSAISPQLLGRTEVEVAAGRSWSVLVGPLLLGLALVAFAVVTHFAAGPGGVAIGMPPKERQLAADLDTSATSSGTTPRSEQHLVLVTDSSSLADLLQARIAANDLVKSEAGALAPAVTFEVILVPSDDDLATLVAGLAEYEAQCVTSPCPAIRVLDLRSMPTMR